MKKGWGKIFVILIILITSLLLILNEGGKSTGLSKKEKVEEVEYLYKTIEENYPFLEVNERLTGIDWISHKEEYLGKAKETKNDEEYLELLNIMVSRLYNRHTHIISEKEELLGMYKFYSNCYGWLRGQLDVINNDKVLSRYGITEEELNDISEISKEEIKLNDANNASVKDIIEGKVGYITIPSMLNYYELDRDRDLINTYFNKISNYEALIIDIRGNRGGGSAYWMDLIVPKLINKPYSHTEYNFMKDGEIIREYLSALEKDEGNPYETIDKLEVDKLSNIPPEVKEKFKYYDEVTITINPNDSVNFKGNIYLLVDDVVYSAAETFAVFAKESGFATLIGKTTGGDGIGNAPVLISLPNSGYIFRMSKELGTTSDGTCNEEYKTIPDYEVTISRKKENYLDDECIQKVLELENLK